MARLYDRLLSGMPSADVARLAGVPVIVGDNVAQYASKSGLYEDGFRVSDIPNIAPPFARFWVEARTGDPDSVGALIEANEVGDGDLADLHRVASGWGRASGYDGEYRSLLGQGVKWAVNLSLFAAGRYPWPGKDLGVMQVLTTFCRADGSQVAPGPMVCQLSGGGWIDRRFAALEKAAVDNFARLTMLSRALLLTVSFMHCKNVVRREVQQDAPLSKKWERKHGRPLVRYHVLDIDPMRKVLRDEGRSEETGLKKALHICRGHFATYTDEAPLFGRVTGTFWKPQHVRGNLKHGAVVKDYNVKAPRL